MNYSDIVNILSNSNLKVTPQRVAVLEALYALKDHPTADAVKEYVRKNHPNLAIGTLYKILETFCEKGIVKKVKTDRDFMRYDIDMHRHHHLYCEVCDTIENYYDEGLDALLQDYFSKKQIPNFEIKDINLQIIGNFKPNKSN
ncbi:MAG: Fur family transcriptional regulator [Bacteroidales bacterium]